MRLMCVLFCLILLRLSVFNFGRWTTRILFFVHSPILRVIWSWWLANWIHAWNPVFCLRPSERGDHSKMRQELVWVSRADGQPDQLGLGPGDVLDPELWLQVSNPAFPADFRSLPPGAQAGVWSQWHQGVPEQVPAEEPGLWAGFHVPEWQPVLRLQWEEWPGLDICGDPSQGWPLWDGDDGMSWPTWDRVRALPGSSPRFSIS